MKKTSKKLHIAQMPKPLKYDLSFNKADQNAKIIVALESLKVNAGWVFLGQIFQKNIEQLAKQIIRKVDEDGKPIAESDVDRLRDRHSYLEELMDKPDYFLKSLTRTDTEPEDLDPYDKKVK